MLNNKKKILLRNRQPKRECRKDRGGLKGRHFILYPLVTDHPWFRGIDKKNRSPLLVHWTVGWAPPCLLTKHGHPLQFIYCLPSSVLSYLFSHFNIFSASRVFPLSPPPKGNIDHWRTFAALIKENNLWLAIPH